MQNRKVETFHARKETLPEVLAEMKKILEATDKKEKVLLTQVFNSIEGFFYELIIVIEA